VGGVPGTGKETVASFDTSIPSSAGSTQFIIQISDQKGNYRQLRFELDNEKTKRRLKPGVKLPFADMALHIGTSRPWRTVPEAGTYRLLLGNGLFLTFKNVIKAGEVSITWTSARPPNGYLEALGSTFILRSWNGLQFDHVSLAVDSGDLKLTPSQLAALKILRVDDPRSGKYVEMPARRQAGKREFDAELRTLGKYMLAAPLYKNGHSSSMPGGAKVNGPEVEFLSGVETKLALFDLKSKEGLRLINILKEQNRLPVGNIYRIWPEEQALEPSGVLKMRYSDKAVSALGMD